MKEQRIVVLCDNLFEESELLYPYFRLKEEGFHVVLAGDEIKEYRSKNGYPITPDLKVADLSLGTTHGVVIPGGFAPDFLRRSPHVLHLVRELFQKKKVVAAICHGPWVMISAGILKGKEATCFLAIKDDLVNAGAIYRDEPVVVDGNLITSRTPADLPVFLPAIIRSLQGE